MKKKPRQQKPKQAKPKQLKVRQLKSKSEGLHTAAQAYLDHLRSQGKKERTLYTYGKDFEQIEAFCGADRKLASILPAHAGRFLKSDELLKIPKSGKERSKPTIEKTVRVLRMFLLWAKETNRIAKLPLPRGTPMGRSGKKVADEGKAEPAAA